MFRPYHTSKKIFKIVCLPDLKWTIIYYRNKVFYQNEQIQIDLLKAFKEYRIEEYVKAIPEGYDVRSGAPHSFKEIKEWKDIIQDEE